MATFKSLFTDTVGKLVSRECKVTAATSPGPQVKAYWSPGKRGLD